MKRWFGDKMTSKQVGRDLKRSVLGDKGRKQRPSDLLYSKDTCSVARELMIEYGPEAPGIALTRADQALDADDGEGFQVWLEVAAAIQDFVTRSDD